MFFKRFFKIKFYQSLFFYFFILISFTFAQEKREVDFSTPQSTITHFLTYLQSETFEPRRAALALQAQGYTAQEKENLAIKLIQILDGKGLFVEIEELPNDPNYTDSLSGKAKYILFRRFPDIYVEKVGNDWLFSAHTVRNIPRLHQMVYPLGLDRLLQFIPKGANKKFLGLSTWQYLGISILLVLSWLIYRLLSFLLGRVLLRFILKVGRDDFGNHLIQPLARPLSLFILFLLLSNLIPALGLPVYLNKFILLAINISLHVFAIVIALRLVDFFSSYLSRMAEKTSGMLDDQLMPLIRKAMKIIIVILGVIYILQFIKVDVTTLIAGLSIGTLAFALAAQDTIKNLFGSVTIFLDRPFQVGDWVVGDGIDGTIEEVGFRSTRIRTFHNSLIYIPNGKLADMTIDNMGLREYRRFKTMIAITYDTPPALIDAFIEGIRQIILKHPHTHKDNYHVYLNNFAASSLDILFYAFFRVPSWADELRARHELMLAILRLASLLGVRFAFPTQTIHLEDLPGQKSLTPEYPKEALQAPRLNQKIEQFISGCFEG